MIFANVISRSHHRGVLFVKRHVENINTGKEGMIPRLRFVLLLGKNRIGSRNSRSRNQISSLRWPWNQIRRTNTFTSLRIEWLALDF